MKEAGERRKHSEWAGIVEAAQQTLKKKNPYANSKN